VFTLVVLLGSCAPNATLVESRSPGASQSPVTSLSAASRPSAAVGARIVGNARRFHTVPDGLQGPPAGVLVQFDGDPSPTEAFARLRPIGTEAPLELATGPNLRAATFDLHGLAPGSYAVDVVERLAQGDSVVATYEFKLSAPEYVIWTLDFEGDAASDEALANTAAIAEGFKIPMTVMWNPRVWTTQQVTPARAETMLAWTKGRAAAGDEVSLHLHMWTDFVRAAGLVPRTSPSWAGRGDGYDVPLSAYAESDQLALIEYSLRLMSEHGLARPTTFRAGGQFADDATLRTLAALGFAADASAVPAGAFGRLPYPWTLAADAQPYRPSSTDANKPGDLPLLEAPTIGGNTYAFDVRTIQPIIRADLSYLAPAGEIAPARRALTIVSHPGTIDATERAAIEALFDAFGPLRYDADRGPVRFVTLAELAEAWR